MFDTLAGLLIEAVLNGLWQGILLTALLWLLLRFLPCSAAMRYAAWYACLVAVLSLPAVHLAVSTWPASSAPAVAIEAPPARITPETVSSSPAPPEAASASVWSPPDLSLPVAAAVALLAGWLVVASLLGVRLLLSYLGMARLKNNSKPLDDPDTGRWSKWFAACFTRRAFDVRGSSEAPLPMLAGLTRPAILFPESLVPRLTAEEKFRICLHELAHIRRCDDWANLFQRIAETALFFHPGIRWIGNRLNLEREIACDDWVVAVSGSARPYAACLVRLAEYASLAPHPAPALGSASDRKQIIRRVEMLLNRKRNAKPGWSKAVFAGVLLICLAASVVAAKMAPVITVDDPPAPVVAPAAPAAPAAPVVAAAPAAPRAPRAPSGQAPPAPPAPPVPAAEPAPAPEPPLTREQTRRIAEEAHRAAEMAREMAERMRPKQEEMQKLAEEMRKEVEASIKPKTDEIRKLSEQIREKVEASIKPHTREIEELAKKMAAEHAASKPNEEMIRKLEQEMRSHETEMNQVVEKEVKALEEKIHAIELTIKPSEEQMRKFESKMQELEKELEEQGRELERQFERERPATPPPPAAPPARTTPPSAPPRAPAAPATPPVPPAPGF